MVGWIVNRTGDRVSQSVNFNLYVMLYRGAFSLCGTWATSTFERDRETLLAREFLSFSRLYTWYILCQDLGISFKFLH